ncbi:protein SIX6OS1 isoform X6 [Mugil cephalus]|uniref:protein SIX6OS1 isoform X6 n=1 Tax=Mugil cephalus TaxID=48193 RepID=UPI001FB6868B|nr:protein SIX6OS1 isoform X6 [Mugil cephalus]
MSDQYSLNNIDSLLFQLALQTRELSQKKNEIFQHIKVCRDNIAERRSHIETVHKHVKKLDEEIGVRQHTVTNNKAKTKSMKVTNSLLLQYEQSLKAELESRKTNYNRDMEIYEERIASYRRTFQSHQEYYFQDPLAQKLLMLQAEKEEIDRRIRACDDQIKMKQRELDHLTGPAVSSFSTEKLPDSVFGQQYTTEEKQEGLQTKEDSASVMDISLHLKQTRILEDGHQTSVEANAEEIYEKNKVRDSPTCCTSPEKPSQSQPIEIYTENQDQETAQEDRVLAQLEEQPSVPAVEEVLEEEMQVRTAMDEEQAPGEDNSEGHAAFPQTSPQGTNPQTSPAKETALPSPATFPFRISTTSSPRPGTSDTKSPAFLFSLNSNPSTPGFSGFGFESLQEEDSTFPFAGSFFEEKKTTESKSSSGPEFLFGQPEQNEDFQFAFTSKSPQSANKENTREDFPFSFNF